MKQEKRVLSRKNARELSPQEVSIITGGIRTATVCTIGATPKSLDGDPGEC
ncbi:MAG TPA: hypothetical protein VE783_03745 [Candidatus Limnocylindrales bacterium]|jgi:hypothetical protein|nr:hypothetical protein [Candidatus Limnocylindrales bacterium]